MIETYMHDVVEVGVRLLLKNNAARAEVQVGAQL